MATHKIALVAPVDGLTPLSLVASDANKKLESVSLGDGLDYGSGGLLSLIPGEINHDLLLNVHQDVNTDASPTFVDLILSAPSSIYSLSHNSFADYSANKHIDHTAVSITAGTGLTGGGDISATRSLALSHLGIESLTDPTADRILFWDESAPDACKWLTATEGVQISTTNLKADINGLTADSSPDKAADYVMTYDASAGTHKKVLLEDLPSGGTGDVSGPGSSADNAIVRFDGTTGKAIQDSLPLVLDTGEIRTYETGIQFLGELVEDVGTWTTPTGCEPGSWTNPANAYDGDEATKAGPLQVSGSYGIPFIWTFPSCYCTKVQVNATALSNVYIRVSYYDGSWHIAQTDILISNTPTWYEVVLSGGDVVSNVTKFKVEFRRTGAESKNAYLREGQYYDVSPTRFKTTLLAGSLEVDTVYTLPLTDGTNGQVLTTNGSGVLSWSSAGGYSDEQAQDAVGTILVDTTSVDFTYDDATPQITAVVLPAGVNHNALQNYIVNEHINHSGVSITAGSGLTGGGDLTATRTLSLNINGLTEDLSPNGTTDYVATWDVSAGMHKKVLLNNLPGGGGATTFLQLTDTPDSYDSIDALKFVRVKADLTGLEFATPAGGGDVTGPISSTDNAIARFDGTSGTTIQNSSILIDDNGNVEIKSGTELRLYDADNSNYVGFKAPSLSVNKIWVLPNVDGSANQYLKTDGNGNLGWATSGGGISCQFSSYRDTNQSINKATWTKVQNNQEHFDPDTVYDNSVNYQFTAPSAGYYIFFGKASLEPSSGARVLLAFFKNGTEFYRIADLPAASTYWCASGSYILYLSQNDYVELYVYQAGTASCYLKMSFFAGYKVA